MRSRFPTSIGLGRWGGVVVRLHGYFVVFAAATLYLCWPAQAPDAVGVPSLWAAAGDMRGIAAAALAVLLCSVWLHELAHWWVARYHGLQPDVIILGPLGGLTPWGRAERAGVELSIWSAGPVANLAIACVSRGWLAVRGGPESLVTGWNPFRPDCFGGEEGGLVPGVQFIAWVNWLLFLLSILPASPFDGARILDAASRGLRPAWSAQRRARWVEGVAFAGAGLLLTAALELWRRQGAGALFPAWLPLLLLGVLTLMGTRLPSGNASPTAAGDLPSCARHRPGRRRDASLPPRRPRQVRSAATPPAAAVSDTVLENAGGPLPEEPDEQQMDAILSRVHAHGLQSLSAQERVLLERASARYRSRLRKPT